MEIKFVAVHPERERVHALVETSLADAKVLSTCGRRLDSKYLIKQAHLADTKESNPNRCKQCTW